MTPPSQRESIATRRADRLSDRDRDEDGDDVLQPVHPGARTYQAQQDEGRDDGPRDVPARSPRARRRAAAPELPREQVSEQHSRPPAQPAEVEHGDPDAGGRPERARRPCQQQRLAALGGSVVAGRDRCDAGEVAPGYDRRQRPPAVGVARDGDLELGAQARSLRSGSSSCAVAGEAVQILRRALVLADVGCRRGSHARAARAPARRVARNGYTRTEIIPAPMSEAPTRNRSRPGPCRCRRSPRSAAARSRRRAPRPSVRADRARGATGATRSHGSRAAGRGRALRVRGLSPSGGCRRRSPAGGDEVHRDEEAEADALEAHPDDLAVGCVEDESDDQARRRTRPGRSRSRRPARGARARRG